jgi:uncharacterized membrane protein YoaK (UPF0700 family)
MSHITPHAVPAEEGLEALRREAAANLWHPLTTALLALTVTTGVVDAVSFLGLGRVFTANMTGNVVLLGFGIAGGAGLPVVSPMVSLASFLAGAACGGAINHRLGDRFPRYLSYALVIEVGLLVLAAILAAVLDVRPNHVSGDVIIALLAFAMGVRNSAVRHTGIPDLTTTVLTMTLTAFAADSKPAGGSGAGSARRVAAVLAMFAGALVGAALEKSGLVAPLCLALALALLTWVVFIPAARRHPRAGSSAAG